MSETVIQVKDLTRWYIQKKVTKQDGKKSARSRRSRLSTASALN